MTERRLRKQIAPEAYGFRAWGRAAGPAVGEFGMTPYQTCTGAFRLLNATLQRPDNAGRRRALSSGLLSLPLVTGCATANSLKMHNGKAPELCMGGEGKGHLE